LDVSRAVAKSPESKGAHTWIAGATASTLSALGADGVVCHCREKPFRFYSEPDLEANLGFVAGAREQLGKA
jgi:hypothetical protein